MKNILLTIILVFSILPSFSHDKEGWYFEENLRPTGMLDRFVTRNDTLFSPYEDGEDTYLFYSVDNGDNFQEYMFYDYSKHVSDGNIGQTNPGEPILSRDGHIFIVNDFRFSFYFLENGKREFEHRITESHGIIDSYDMYDKNLGIAAAPGKYNYITRDGWRTVEEVEKGEYITATDYFKFINDSVAEGNAYAPSPIRTTYYGHYNLNTKTWQTYGAFPDEAKNLMERFDKVNDNLIYASADGLKNGFGEQDYDLIYRSRDGGLTWENILFNDIENGFGLNHLSFYDEMNGFSVGNGGRIFQTNNGGETWEYIDLEKEDRAHPEDDLYGPIGNKSYWSDTVPLMSTLRGHIYRYQGDFFDFDYKDIEPALLSLPTDNSMIQNNEILSWSGGEENPEYYHLQITTSTRDYDRWLNLSVNEKLNEKTYNITGLSPDSTYYWRVLTVKGSLIRESEVRSFEVDEEEDIKLTEIEIKDCKTNNYISTLDTVYRLSWTTSENANAYRVKLSDPPFYQLLDTIVADTILDYNFKGLEGIYVNFEVLPLRVVDNIIVDSLNRSAECALGVRYNPPIITSTCDNDEYVDDLDTLRWESYLSKFPSLHDQLNYSLKMYSDTLENKVEIRDFHIYNDYVAISRYNLKPNTTYYWTVSIIVGGIDYFTSSDESDICSFTTGPNTSIREADVYIKVIASDGLIEAISINPINSLSLIDISGREVARSEYNTIRTNHLSSGIYFLVINGESYKKVVVQ